MVHCYSMDLWARMMAFVLGGPFLPGSGAACWGSRQLRDQARWRRHRQFRSSPRPGPRQGPPGCDKLPLGGRPDRLRGGQARSRDAGRSRRQVQSSTAETRVRTVEAL